MNTVPGRSRSFRHSDRHHPQGCRSNSRILWGQEFADKKSGRKSKSCAQFPRSSVSRRPLSRSLNVETAALSKELSSLKKRRGTNSSQNIRDLFVPHHQPPTRVDKVHGHQSASPTAHGDGLFTYEKSMCREASKEDHLHPRNCMLKRRLHRTTDMRGCKRRLLGPHAATRRAYIATVENKDNTNLAQHKRRMIVWQSEHSEGEAAEQHARKPIVGDHRRDLSCKAAHSWLHLPRRSTAKASGKVGENCFLQRGNASTRSPLHWKPPVCSTAWPRRSVGIIAGAGETT